MNLEITKKDLVKGYEQIKQVIDLYITRNDIVFTSSTIAPNSFKRMKLYHNTFNQFLVYNGGDHGHLGREYNIKFRALHDYMHISNNLSFSFRSEKLLSRITETVFANIAYNELNATHFEVTVIMSIIDAEIKGQIEYYQEYGKYVADQTKFIEQYLKVVA